MPRVEILKQNGYHFLWIDGELWMWDVPEEIKDQKEIAKQAYGAVLVAGYGLGIVQKFLKKNPRVTEVHTFEKEEELFELCLNTFGMIYGHWHSGDFYKIDWSKKFDCVIGDIWADQGRKNLKTYRKFKKKAQTLLKPGGKILGWGVDYFEYLLAKSGGDSRKALGQRIEEGEA